MLTTLTNHNFRKTVCDNGTVLVDCWASWCQGCEHFAEVYEKVASQHPEHVFGKLETQTERDLAAEIGVEQIPTLLVFRDGILVFQQAGSFEEAALEDIVAQAESIDMDAVRAHVAEEPKQGAG